MRRFADWCGWAELEPPVDVDWVRGFSLASENGRWRGAAFFVFEQNGWTVFEDWVGYLVDISGPDWLRLAGDDDLVCEGYSNTYTAGWLFVAQGGELVREFRDDALDPAANTDHGRLDFEDESPLRNWLQIASFVDEDELVVVPNQGTLWVFQGE